MLLTNVCLRKILTHIYICAYIFIHTPLSIYTSIERERETKRKKNLEEERRCRNTCNEIGDAGAGVLPQCPCFYILGLFGKQIGAEGAGRLAGVLPHCPALFLLSL